MLLLLPRLQDIHGSFAGVELSHVRAVEALHVTTPHHATLALLRHFDHAGVVPAATAQVPTVFASLTGTTLRPRPVLILVAEVRGSVKVDQLCGVTKRARPFRSTPRLKLLVGGFKNLVPEIVSPPWFQCASPAVLQASVAGCSRVPAPAGPICDLWEGNSVKHVHFLPHELEVDIMLANHNIQFAFGGETKADFLFCVFCP